jgi:hypothetical protein
MCRAYSEVRLGSQPRGHCVRGGRTLGCGAVTDPALFTLQRFVLLSLLLATLASRAQSLSETGSEAPAPEVAATPEVAPATRPAPDEAPPSSALTALYPLWENTGHVLGHRRLFLGTSNAELGLFDVAQVGVHPLFFIFRTLNVHGKVRLLSRERLSLAAHAEVLVFLPGASEAFTTSNYVSRMDTRDVLLTVVPVGVSASFAATPRLYLHGTATVAGMFDDGPYRNRLVPGATLVAELLALEHHSLSAHVGEVGFWDHDFTSLGASYRYRRGWFEVRVGYFYRFMKDGRQSNPLLALGVYL